MIAESEMGYNGRGGWRAQPRARRLDAKKTSKIGQDKPARKDMTMALITISENIKQEIARRLLEQESAGYSTAAQGAWYVVDGSQVVHADDNRPWNPWHDDADVITVDELVFDFGGAGADHADFTLDSDATEEDFGNAMTFVLDYVPDSYDTEATQAARYAEG